MLITMLVFFVWLCFVFPLDILGRFACRVKVGFDNRISSVG